MLPDKWQSPQCFYGCITTMPLHPNAILLVRELIQQHIILLCVDEIVAYIAFPPIFNIANNAHRFCSDDAIILPKTYFVNRLRVFY